MKGRVTEFHFRDKTAGWKLYGQMIIQRENGQKKEVFLNQRSLRITKCFRDVYISGKLL